ncbi:MULTISPECIES: TauD/TfdA family dioxygenase [unclassified Thioalkalivibrio]|uniref:TauD/TfdA family dioxygenase n=1 Tax=unclassified Thioalkalivibrio TaxID=2621013 RepID=UPI0009DB3741|nr:MULTISPECIES: TauD/TfdA family dioxygenase [unclassified Thioalkalivibrio]
MLSSLKQKGWWKGKRRGPSLDDDLCQIANRLGQPVGARRKSTVLEVLKPKSAESAYPNSLSAQHERSSFPYHVDTAHWPTPCKFVVMGCKSPGIRDRKTILIDWESLKLDDSDIDLLQSAVFLVKNGARSFYSSIISTNNPFVRYDTGCMQATGPDSKMALKILQSSFEKAEKIGVRWEKDDILVIDNWRFLHGRDRLGGDLSVSESRELHRVLVK